MFSKNTILKGLLISSVAMAKVVPGPYAGSLERIDNKDSSVHEVRTSNKDCHISNVDSCVKDKRICALKIEFNDCDFVSFRKDVCANKAAADSCKSESVAKGEKIESWTGYTYEGGAAGFIM